MTVTERRRHRLHQKLDEVLGLDDATTTMELLPPTGWADVARRDDLDRVETTLGAQITRVEADLRGEIERVETSLRGEIERVETSLRGEIERVETSLRGEIVHQGQVMAERFAWVDHRFEAIDHRFEAIDGRFEALDRRMERFEGQMERMAGELRTEFRSLLRMNIASTFAALSLGLAAARFLFI
ncbi:MAG TPA: hypothetical protein VGA36_06050 [Nitriliruptorales bacterium]